MILILSKGLMFEVRRRTNDDVEGATKMLESIKLNVLVRHYTF